MAELDFEAARKVPWSVYVVLAGGVAAVSLAAIFIRLAQQEQIPSLLIAAGRLALAVLILTPFTLRRHWEELRQLARSDLQWALVSGLFLAIHFATWVKSLEYTSVLISVVLVATSPLWVALLEVTLLKSRLRAMVIGGLALALVGGTAIGIGGGTVAVTSDTVTGGLLALVGAVTVAVYYIIGRRLRQRMSFLPYIWLVYGCAAVLLVVALLATRTAIEGYRGEGYFWLILLALFPQLMGHSSFNYVLRYLPATYVSVASQMEPVGSAMAAYVVFGEVPEELQIVGSGLILVGVVLASLGQAGSEQGEG